MDRGEYDVAVIGGGPGGSSAAADLAQRGRRVVLFERDSFPRYHVGESLLPLWDVWDRLGLTDQVVRAGFAIKQGMCVNLFDAEEDWRFTAAEFPERFARPGSYHVSRAEYDALLLDNARSRGVEVRQPWTVHEVVFQGSRAVGVRAGPTAGPTSVVRAAVVVDATGRDCFLAHRLGLREPDRTLNKVAYYTHFRGALRRDRDGAVATDAIGIDGGWIWYIPLADDVVSVGAVLNAEFVRRSGVHGLQARFDHAIAQSRRVGEWIRGAEQCLPVQTVSNISYLNRRLVGDGFLLVGDAAMFVDPIFSSGVALAMKSGCLAAETIDAALAHGDVSDERLVSYERQLRDPMERVFDLVRNWYFVLGSREYHNLFERAARSRALREHLVAVLSGDFEAGDLEALENELDIRRVARAANEGDERRPS